MSPFTPEQESTLCEVIAAVAPAEVVLIGAGAIGLHVPMDWRRTSDLDLVLAVELDAFESLAKRLPGWRRDPRREHVWHSPHGVDVDLVPAGPTLRARGALAFPQSGNVMDLVEVLAVMKMVSWLDSPHRQHDLADLAHVLESWLPIDDERRYDDDIVAEQVPYDDVPALLLGRRIAAVAKAPHLAVVRRFLDHVGDDRNAAHGIMLKRGPVSWRNDEERFDRRLAVLRRGVGL